MNTINFGDYNSFIDFSLILTGKTIGSPEAKTSIVEIEGGDGELDYTEYFGDVFFNNRTLKFDFETIVSPSEFSSLFSQIQNALHGKKMKVRLSEDNEFYYYGRIIVNEWKSNKRIGKITIEVDADPYKYKNFETVRTVAAGGGFVLSNLRKRATPSIEVNGSVTLTFEGTVYNLTSGEYLDSSITLKEGNNYFYTEGTGTITFKYQEGGL